MTTLGRLASHTVSLVRAKSYLATMERLKEISDQKTVLSAVEWSEFVTRLDCAMEDRLLALRCPFSDVMPLLLAGNEILLAQTGFISESLGRPEYTSTPANEAEIVERITAEMMASRLLAEYDANAPAHPFGILVLTNTGPLPAAIGGNSGSTVASGAPQKPLQPKYVLVEGTDRTTQDGGTRGVLISALFIGSDMQLMWNVPGQQSGLPVELLMAMALDTPWRFDCAYPAIGVTVNYLNPTPHTVPIFRTVFAGRGIS